MLQENVMKKHNTGVKFDPHCEKITSQQNVSCLKGYALSKVRCT